MGKPWKIPSEIEPKFNGGFIKSKFIKGSLFVVQSTAQRNSTITDKHRLLDGTTTTLCFTTGTNKLWKLINNPNATNTSDSDWEEVKLGASSPLLPVGTWQADNTDPVLTDADALNREGEFYFVGGAPTATDVQFANLFENELTSVSDGDLIVSIGNRWIAIRVAASWESMNKPPAIDDYVNGIVIAHNHQQSEIVGLTAALDSKFDSSNVADSNIAFEDVPNSKIIDLNFLKQHYYTNQEVYSKLEVDALLSQQSSSGSGNMDGGNASTIYSPDQVIDGGGAASTY